MDGVVHCASPLCMNSPQDTSRFCGDHLEIFARVRAEIEEEMGTSTTWKKGVLRHKPRPVAVPASDERLALAA